MTVQRLGEAHKFLEELSQQPPLLPYEPTLLPQLFAATREDSTASIKDLTNLIEHSQKLAARVLAISNSAMYALESTVTSLQRAVALLGFREVRNLVVMVGAVSAVKAAKLPKTFDRVGLWKHQLMTAGIARALTAFLLETPATQQAAPDDKLTIAPEEAYAAGLLHDIGKVFLAAGCPAVWQAVEEMSARTGMTFAEAEDAYWGMEHAVIGAQVLHQWKLPRLLTDPINWHHAPSLAPVFKPEAKMLCAANIIAHQGLDSEGNLPGTAAALIPQDVDQASLVGTICAVLEEDTFETLMGIAV